MRGAQRVVGLRGRCGSRCRDGTGLHDLSGLAYITTFALHHRYTRAGSHMDRITALARQVLI